MVKLNKKIKKAAKKAKKSTKKATNSVTQEVTQTTNTVVEEAEHASKQVVKYGGKAFNKATGAIEDTLDKAIDYTVDDLKQAANYAKKTWEEGTDWIEDLAEDAIEAAYRAIYKKYIDDYVKFVVEIGEAQSKIFAKPTNILTEIRDTLLEGKFSKSMEHIAELLDSDDMKKSLDAGHNLFGTSFVIAADLSFGVSGHGVTGGGGGSVGISYMLDHFDDYKHKACVFTSAGGALGVTNSSGPGAEVGISMGFLAKDPKNISGWFVDVSGEGNIDYGVYGLGMSWSPPGAKPPYVKAKPVAGVGRIGLSTSKDPSGALTIGGSYTWIIQKIKNDLYRG